MQIERQSFTQPWRLEDFQLLAHDQRALNVGLWHGGELVGYALGYVDDEGTELHLASLAVDPEYRRQGWGSYLLAELLTRARHRGCAACRLEVRASNVEAQGLYWKFEFATVGRRRAFYTGPVEDAVLMRRPLNTWSPCQPAPNPGVVDDG